MPLRHRGQARRYLHVIGLLGSVWLLCACTSPEDSSAPTTRTVDTSSNPIVLNDANGAVLQGLRFNLDGSAFPNFGTGASVLAFTQSPTNAARTNFTLSNSVASGAGPLSFGSCIFTFNPAANLPTGQVTVFEPCGLVVQASNVPTDGIPTGGTVQLRLTRNGQLFLASIDASVTITISLGPDGTLLINGKSTNFVVPAPTGTTGTGGTP